MKALKKKVEYESKTYDISFEEYGYTKLRFCVNGESSSEYAFNDQVHNLAFFKKHVQYAIKEYIDRHNAKILFELWDGKI